MTIVEAHPPRTPSALASQAQAASVLLVEDHELVGAALGLALDQDPGLRVVGQAGTIAQGVEAAGRLRPDLVITDLRLPDGDVHEHLGRFRAASPGARILVLTGWPTERCLLAALDAGAQGLVSKAQNLPDLVGAARRVLAGDLVIPPWLVPSLLGRRGGARPTAARQLTERELDVLELLAGGHTTPEVADRLCISVNTLRNHLSSAMAKLHARTRLEAVSEAVRLGLVTPPHPAAR